MDGSVLTRTSQHAVSASADGHVEQMRRSRGDGHSDRAPCHNAQDARQYRRSSSPRAGRAEDPKGDDRHAGDRRENDVRRPPRPCYLALGRCHRGIARASVICAGGFVLAARERQPPSRRRGDVCRRLLSIAKSKNARSRKRRCWSSQKRIAQTCCGLSARLAPGRRPSFQARSF